MKKIDQPFLDELIKNAADATRRRSHFLLHDSHDDQVQKLVVAMMPDSYIRPHLHPQKGKFELVTAIKGSFKIIFYDRNGLVLDTFTLSPSDCPIVDFPEHTWHSMIALEPAVFMEVKPGPFTAIEPEDFAPWAPEENSPDVETIMSFYKDCQKGDQFT